MRHVIWDALSTVVDHSSLTIGFRTLCSGAALVVARLISTQQPNISINLLGNAGWVCKRLWNQRYSWKFTRNTRWVRLCWHLGTGIYYSKSDENKQNRTSGRRHGVVTSVIINVPISKKPTSGVRPDHASHVNVSLRPTKNIPCFSYSRPCPVVTLHWSWLPHCIGILYVLVLYRTSCSS